MFIRRTASLLVVALGACTVRPLDVDTGTTGETGAPAVTESAASESSVTESSITESSAPGITTGDGDPGTTIDSTSTGGSTTVIP